MRPLGTIKMNEFVPIEPPTILQKAINKKMLPMLVVNMIIVLWCSLAHTLTPILNLFSKYAPLFDGTM
jgi:hypothetical protein